MPDRTRLFSSDGFKNWNESQRTWGNKIRTFFGMLSKSASMLFVNRHSNGFVSFTAESSLASFTSSNSLNFVVWICLFSYRDVTSHKCFVVSKFPLVSFSCVLSSIYRQLRRCRTYEEWTRLALLGCCTRFNFVTTYESLFRSSASNPRMSTYIKLIRGYNI